MGEFTTDDKIFKRLTGRLEQTDGSAFGRRGVDAGFVTQVHGQAEGRVILAIRQNYKYPLTNSHPILGEITEKLSVCDLLPVYYQGESASNDGYLKIVCDRAYKDLKALQNGEILLPGEIPIDVPEPGQAVGSYCKKLSNPEPVQWGTRKRPNSPSYGSYRRQY